MRKFPRKKTASAGEAFIMQYRCEFLGMIHALSDVGDFLRESLPLMLVLVSEEKFQLFTQAFMDEFGSQREKADTLPKGRERITRHFLMLDAFDNEDKDQTSLTIAQFLIRFLDAPAPATTAISRIPFLAYLCDNLKLNEAEERILFRMHLIAASRYFAWVLHRMNSMSEFKDFLAKISGLRTAVVQRVVSPTGKLMRTKLIESHGDGLTLGDNVLDAFLGHASIDDFQCERYRPDTQPCFPSESFDLGELERKTILALLKSEGSCHILFYGKPGAGKSELARSLIQEAGLRTLLVPADIEDGERRRMSNVCFSSFFSRNAVIVVDEAESILNTQSRFTPWYHAGTPAKSQLNVLFDECRAKIIWITNDADDIHESTLRRFHFKLHFEKLSLKQREYAMELILRKHNRLALKKEPFVEAAIRDEFITPGILDNVIQSFNRIESSDSSLDAKVVIPRLIQSHRPEANENEGISRQDEHYRLDILNTSGRPEQIIDTAQAFFSRDRRSGAGLNLLLHGLPGTGKTEFVKFVAQQCGRDVLFKRGSDLLSMWLGGTEHNIARAFREAESREAILLVDEADTFFQPREQAQRSWEVSQTNEFLNQMENHRILLFCCTNLISRLDAASMRRFHFKLEFRAMLRERRVDFFVSYFKDLLVDSPPTGELELELGRLTTLTPGDFRAVRQRYSYRPQGSTAWQELVTQLESEGSYKKVSQNRTIGF